jgi:hypothetical protein
MNFPDHYYNQIQARLERGRSDWRPRARLLESRIARWGIYSETYTY